MRDPTRAEMLEALRADMGVDTETDPFDVESAIYWFANDWHGGKSSNLYSVLSTSEYHPGPIESGCEPDSLAGDLYQTLVFAFATTDAERQSSGD